MLIVIDTNTLIRYFTNDDEVKANLVEDLLKNEKKIFIPDVVFPELEYVLISKYNFPRNKLCVVYKALISKSNIIITSEIKTAIRIFENTKLDMADCIIAASALSGKLASFDKELLDVDGLASYWK